jgi:hypothetical protein
MIQFVQTNALLTRSVLYTTPILAAHKVPFTPQIRLPENNLNFSAVKLDSIVLTLKYQNKTAFYGNTATTQTIKVYELSNSLYIDSVYYSNARPAYYPQEIGSWTGKFNLNDSITLQHGSKTRKLPPHLRIRITDNALY